MAFGCDPRSGDIAESILPARLPIRTAKREAGDVRLVRRLQYEGLRQDVIGGCTMSNESLLRIRVSLKGRPIKAYTFDGETVSIGRDPDADVFLDNTGISRAHAKIARTHGGFELEDLNSANGTYLNDVAISKEPLKENDVVRVGKFSLWITVTEDRRAAAIPRKVSPDAFQGTTVLSGDQLNNMVSSSKEHEEEQEAIQPFDKPEYEEVEAGGWQPNKSVLVIAMAVAFLLGSALGVGATTWLLRH
jgi:hypothetical protein